MNPFFANPPGVMFLFPFSLSIHHAIVRSYQKFLSTDFQDFVSVTNYSPH